MARKYIRRVSKVKNDDTKGYIINSTNVENKEKNTYSANVIDGLLNGGKVKVKTISNMTPSTYSNNTYLVTDIPLKNTSILSIFCKNRYGYNFIPLQYTNVNADNWVITDTKNSLTGTFSLTIVYFEFDNSINMYSD